MKNDIINLKDSDVEMSDTDSIYDNACSDEVQQAYVDKMNELDSKVTHNWELIIKFFKKLKSTD